MFFTIFDLPAGNLLRRGEFKHPIMAADTITISTRQFMALLKESGLVIGPKTSFNKYFINGIPLAQYRERILLKNWISIQEIVNAQLLGIKDEKQILQVLIDHNAWETKRKIYQEWKIPRSVVRILAVKLGHAAG